MDNNKPAPKMTMSDICYHFGFTTRKKQNERADLDYLRFSLESCKNTLKRRYKFDFDTHPKRKPLPYNVIVFIFKQFQ